MDRGRDMDRLRRYRLLENTRLDQLPPIKYVHIDIREDETIENGDLGFFVTASDTVYAIGSNYCGRLGLPTEVVYTRAIKYIHNLSFHGIKGFTIGERMVLACSHHGSLYRWGSERHHGNAIVPAQINVQNKRVIKASCYQRCFALCEDGNLFYWIGFENPECWPFSIENPIIDFADANGQLAVITRNYELLIWRHRALKYLLRPRRLSACRFVKIIASKSHFTALSTEGDVYSWGSDGSLIGLNEPKQVVIPPEYGIDSIYCGSHAPYSVVVSGGNLLIWEILDRREELGIVVRSDFESVLHFLAINNVGMGRTMKLM